MPVGQAAEACPAVSEIIAAAMTEMYAVRRMVSEVTTDV
jgi:hypothetical protein